MTRPPLPTACPGCGADLDAGLDVGGSPATHAIGRDYPGGWGWPSTWACPRCRHEWPSGYNAAS